MSGFEAFATAFMQDTAANINRRKDKADDYFDKQLERASTVGAEAVRARKAKLESFKGLAHDLQTNADMPEDVLRAIANDGPAALEQAYKLYEVASEKGVPLGESFWRDTYKFAKDTKPSGQPLDEFLGEVIGLMPDNIEAAKQEGGSPFDAFVASGMGYNAMERAQKKLASTDIGGGITASQALAMENMPESTRPLGGGRASPNLPAFYDSVKEAETTTPLSATEIKTYTEMYDTEVERLAREEAAANGGDLDAARETVKEQAAANILRAAGSDEAQLLERAPAFIPYADLANEPGDEEVPTDYVPPATFNDPVTGEKLTFSRQEGVASFYKREDGSEVKMKTSDVRDNVAEQAPQGVAPPEEIITSPIGGEPAPTTQQEQSTPTDIGKLVEEAFSGNVSPDNFFLKAGEAPPESFSASGRQFTLSHDNEEEAVYMDQDGNEITIPIRK